MYFFEFLTCLLEDELMNSWTKLKEFEKFERKHGQNVREYFADFDLKLKKLEKITLSFHLEILAFKLFRNVNFSKQERMLDLTSLNFAEKENMYSISKPKIL